MTVLRKSLLGLTLLLTWPVSALAEAPVTVFAAASLKTALDAVAADWDGKVVLSYGGSGTIARQVALGAPADLVVLANAAWMEWLAGQGALGETPVPLLGNRLVVIGPSGAAPVTPDSLAARLGDGRLAIGQVNSVPAGIYGKEWLQAIGVWPAVATRLAETENVRAALALVARGETPLGITYASDAVAESRVEVVFEVPADSHGPISYPVALTARASQQAAGFRAHLASPGAMRTFLAHGFLPPAGGG